MDAFYNIASIMRKYFSIVFLFFTVFSVNAQEQQSLDQQADILYNNYDYARAASIYERLVKRKRVRDITWVRLADCYRQMNHYSQAADIYAKLIARPGAQPDWKLYYGDMLMSLGKYDEAKEAFQQYANGGNGGDKVQHRLEGCDLAPAWIAQPTTAQIQPVNGLNSSSSDWAATFYPGGIIFMTDTLLKKQLNPNSNYNKNRYGRTNNSYYKLYYAEHQDNKDLKAWDFSSTFNQYKYHVGPIVFNKDFNAAYFTLTNPVKSKHIAREKEGEKPSIVYGYRRLELYYTEKDSSSGIWKQPVPFPYNNPGAYSLGQAAFSGDGQTIYFTSDMPGGQGGTDIWYSTRQPDGTWSQPVNCGATINTPEDEAFPTISGNNLYFSSKGWSGMGGYDIFRSTGFKANWSAPENLKYPTNSPADDFYYNVNQNGFTYFASNRAGGMGSDDIYALATPTVIETIPRKPIITLIGTVCPSIPGACIYIYNKQRQVGWCFIGHPNREIVLTLEPDTDYEIRVTMPGGPTHYTEFTTRGEEPNAIIRKAICIE